MYRCGCISIGISIVCMVLRQSYIYNRNPIETGPGICFCMSTCIIRYHFEYLCIMDPLVTHARYTTMIYLQTNNSCIPYYMNYSFHISCHDNFLDYHSHSEVIQSKV